LLSSGEGPRYTPPRSTYIHSSQERHIARPGDVLVANTEQEFEFLLIGFPAIVPKRYGEAGLYSHHLYRVRPLPNSPLSSSYVYQLFLQGRLHDGVAGYSNGTTVNMLPKDALQRPRLPVPPQELVDRYDEVAGPMFDRIEHLHDESQTVVQVRDTLLPKLLSGELRVPDAELFSESLT